MRILGPLTCSSTSPVTATFDSLAASVVTSEPSTTSATGRDTFAPGSASSFSTFTMSPVATLYCLPPVLTIAYVILLLAGTRHRGAQVWGFVAATASRQLVKVT